MIHHLMCPFYRMMDSLLQLRAIRDFVQVLVEVVGTRCSQEYDAEEDEHRKSRYNLETAWEVGAWVESSRHGGGELLLMRRPAAGVLQLSII